MKFIKALKDFGVMMAISLLISCLSKETGAAIWENLVKDGWDIKKK